MVADALISCFKQALSEGWGYIWGASGQTWTKAKQDAATRSQTVKYGSKWIGKRVADCSGLFVWAFKQFNQVIYHGSNTIWKRYCSAQGEIGDGHKLLPGTAVFKTNASDRYHIGLYIGDGKVIEAKGTQNGVVESSIGSWDEWGELIGVEYEGKEGELVMQTLRMGSIGETVRELQVKLGVTADGVFGKNTEAAVREFQMKNGLDVDGIVGPKTWAVLNGDLTQISSSRIVSADEGEELEGFENEAIKTQILGIIYDAVKQIEEVLK